MKPNSKLLAIVLLIVAQVTAADTFTVGPDPTCSTSSLQQAIDVASQLEGEDEIRVSAQANLVDQAITIGEQDLAIIGGFENCAAPTAGTYTFLDGNGSAPVFHITGDGVRILRNLVVREGGGPRGGGIRFEGHGVVRLENSVIEQNAAQAGGGLYIKGLQGETGTAVVELVEGTRISDNVATDGGGIFVQDNAYVRLAGAGVIVARNDASDRGGGIAAFNESTIEISSTGVPELGTLVSNRARRGGGVFLYADEDSDADFPHLQVWSESTGTPVVLMGNEASAEGGAIYSHNADDDHFQKSPLIELKDFALRSNSASDGAAIFIRAAESDNYGNIAGNLLLGASASDCTAVPCGLVRGNVATTPDGRTLVLEAGSSALIRNTQFLSNRGRSVIEAFGEDANLQGPRNFRFEHVLIAANIIDGHALRLGGEAAGFGLVRSTIESSASLPALKLESPGNARVVQNIIANTDSAIPVVAASAGVALHLDENLLTHDSGLAGLGSNLVAAPRFVEPGRDYRLRAGSLAVDFAQATQSDAYDLAGKPRTVDLVEKPDAFGPRDLGAFERYDVGNLVLNGEFDIQRRIWETPVEASPWSVFIRPGPDALGRDDSTSVQIDIPACDNGCTVPPPAPGLNVSYLRQCIHLPGPGTYTLSGKAFIADGSAGRDIPYLAWRLRRSGNENCEGFLAPGDFGFLAFDPNGAGQWKTASEQIAVIPEGEWSPRLSVEVKLDLTRNGDDPPSSNVFGRFDGIRLTWSPAVAPMFSDGFE